MKVFRVELSGYVRFYKESEQIDIISELEVFIAEDKIGDKILITQIEMSQLEYENAKSNE